jgi:SAM-dependent methyltransferase
MQTAERLNALMDHLGLEAACFATQMPGDVAGLAAERPERISGLVLCVPVRLDARPFERVARRLMIISGETGLSAETARRAHERLAQAQRHVLHGYEAVGWSDVVADRTAVVTDTIVRFVSDAARQDRRPTLNPALRAGSGSHAGLTYRIEGHGPALILLPFFRARAPTYRAMFRTLVDLLAPEPTSPVLDVGCGSGALDRLLASWLGPQARIDAVDVNPFLLREAADLSAEFGERIRFAPGSAITLPFADQTFDCIFSVTVLEECDADAAIAEMMRVARPGARIGIVVRAVDLPQWWNLALPADLRARAERPPQSVGPGGVADASLYARMRRAGLGDLRAFPALITLDNPEGPIWRYREDHILSQLSPAETAAWQAARTAANEAGLLMQAHALHCAVATKPVC